MLGPPNLKNQLLSIVYSFPQIIYISNIPLHSAVPVGSGKYKVIHVDVMSCKTITKPGSKFIHSEARWARGLLSHGHNIMAIFIFQSYMGVSLLRWWGGRFSQRKLAYTVPNVVTNRQ